jgi:hypothetical protein
VKIVFQYTQLLFVAEKHTTIKLQVLWRDCGTDYKIGRENVYLINVFGGNFGGQNERI